MSAVPEKFPTIQSRVINWFEIPVAAFDRARRFYEAILDIEMPTDEMHGLNMAYFPTPDTYGFTSGALVQGSGYHPSGHGALVYINAGNKLAKILARVVPAGGEIATQPFEIGKGIGQMAVIRDTEGNRVALHSQG